MPVHSHEGSEYTLVLKGSFRDETGHYGVGDISIADGDVNHRPMISRDEDCICFTVTDAPLRLTGTIGRLFEQFMKRRWVRDPEDAEKAVLTAFSASSPQR